MVNGGASTPLPTGLRGASGLKFRLRHCFAILRFKNRNITSAIVRRPTDLLRPWLIRRYYFISGNERRGYMVNASHTPFGVTHPAVYRASILDTIDCCSTTCPRTERNTAFAFWMIRCWTHNAGWVSVFCVIHQALLNESICF